MTKYQRVATDFPPPLLGDPTPYAGDPQQAANRPLTEQEMNAVLAMTANDNSPVAYSRAVEAVRMGQASGNRLDQFPAANGFDPSNPYGEASANGAGY